MSERETLKITTPIGKREVEVKAYLIGREKRALTNVFAEGMSLNVGTGTNVQSIKESTLEKAENLAFRMIVVSIDGHRDNDTVEGKPFSVVDEILDMRSEDYDFVVKHVNDLRNDGEFDQKKTA